MRNAPQFPVMRWRALIIFMAGLINSCMGIALALNDTVSDDAMAATLLTIGVALSCAFVVMNTGE